MSVEISNLGLGTIIEQAGRSPLGIAALAIVALTFLAIAFFRKTPVIVRLKIFGVLFAGSVMLVAAMIKIASDRTKPVATSIDQSHERDYSAP